MTKSSAASSSLSAAPADELLNDNGPAAPMPTASEVGTEMFQEWELRNVDKGNGRKIWMVRFERSQKQFLLAKVAVELNWIEDDRMFGVLVLPFGLNISEGVRLQLDDGPFTEKLPYAAHGPAGGIIKLDLGSQGLKELRQASKLNILTQPAAGKRKLLFSIPLDGFVAASDRLKVVNPLV